MGTWEYLGTLSYCWSTVNVTVTVVTVTVTVTVTVVTVTATCNVALTVTAFLTVTVKSKCRQYIHTTIQQYNTHAHTKELKHKIILKSLCVVINKWNDPTYTAPVSRDFNRFVLK